MLDFSGLKLTENGPIYQQIIRYVKLAVVSGAVSPGEEIPSRRHLSALLGVNPNTIQKACRLMEEEGLLLSFPGSGSVLSFTADEADLIKEDLIKEDTLCYLASLKAMGLTLDRVLSVVEEGWQNLSEQANKCDNSRLCAAPPQDEAPPPPEFSQIVLPPQGET